MALTDFMGFETGVLNSGWSGRMDVDPASVIVEEEPRNGRFAFKSEYGGNPTTWDMIRRDLGNGNLRATFGVAFKVVANANVICTIAALTHDDDNASTSNGADSVRFQYQNGQIRCMTKETIRYTHNIGPNEWVYLEAYAYHADASSFIEFRINGATVWSGTSDLAWSSAKLRWFALKAPVAAGLTTYRDDVYICHGGTESEFQGPIDIKALIPSGVGTYNQWVGSDGDQVDSHLLVDDVSDSADYVETSVAGNRQTFTLPDVDPNAAVKAVRLNLQVSNAAGMTGVVNPLIKSGASEFEETGVAAAETPAVYRFRYDTNPATGQPWTASDLNGLEVGAELA